MGVEIREIAGFEQYGASADGQVWSRCSGQWQPLKPAKADSKSNGYLKVKLHGQQQFKVHRLVALAWIGERPDALVINHIDGNKRNNAANNLEYVTHRENNLHAIRTGLRTPTYTHTPRPARISKPTRKYQRGDNTWRRRGSDVQGCKLTDDAVRSLRADYTRGMSLRVLGARYGVSSSTALRIVRRVKWAHVA